MVQKFLKIAAVLLILWLAGFGLYAAATLNLAPSPNEKTDAVVVLTGGEGRIEEGMKLWASGAAKDLFISGAHPDVQPLEIRALWKGGGPLPACCVTLGECALTTYENARETAAWMKMKNYKTLRLVTSNFHMLRAYLDLRLVLPRGVKILIQPVHSPDVDGNRQLFWTLLAGEYAKATFRLLTAPFPMGAPRAYDTGCIRA